MTGWQYAEGQGLVYLVGGSKAVGGGMQRGRFFLQPRLRNIGPKKKVQK